MPRTLPVPTNFKLSYNTFTLPSDALTTELKFAPELDPAGRTTQYTKISISVRFYLKKADGDLDTQAQTARQALTKPGGLLKFAGTGAGDLNINTSSVRDVKWGPIPGPLVLKRIDPYKQALPCEWSVTVCIPDCDCAQYAFAVMGLHYTTTIEVKRTGRSVYRVAGELTIPNNRAAPGSRLILDSPDYYWDQIAPPMLPGFDRVWGPRSVDETKTKLSFSWVDTEFPSSVPPPGCISAKLSHRISSSEAGLFSYVSTIRGEYGLAPGVRYVAAMKSFFDQVGYRMLDRAAVDKLTWIPLYYEVDEPDAYDDPKAVFSLTLKLTKSSLEQAISHAGVFLKTTDSDWGAWSLSLSETALNPRGVARLTWTPGEDRIVDLCQCSPTQADFPADPQTAEEMLEEDFPQPTPQASWLEYENDITIEADSGISESRSLPQKEVKPTKPTSLIDRLEAEANGQALPPQPPPFTDPLPDDFLNADPNQAVGVVGGGTVTPDDPKKPDDGPKVQRRVLPAVVIYMTGSAMRAGHQIPCPQLLEIDDGDGGKIVPIPANRRDMGEGFRQGIIYNAIYPVYGATWRQRYILPKTPKGGIGVPRNPMLKDD